MTFRQEFDSYNVSIGLEGLLWKTEVQRGRTIFMRRGHPDCQEQT